MSTVELKIAASAPRDPLLLTLYETVKTVHEARNELLNQLMVREINNHIFLRSHNPNARGEMDENDMQSILYRIELALHTVQRSTPTHASYAGSGQREQE